MDKQLVLNEFFEYDEKDKLNIWKELGKLKKLFVDIKKDIEKREDLNYIKDNLEGLTFATMNTINLINNMEKTKNNKEILSDSLMDMLRKTVDSDLIGSNLFF